MSTDNAPERDSDKKTISINVTDRCNLKCVYCYQDHRRSDLIPFDTATGFIRDNLTADDHFKNVVVELIGGEVFLCADYVQQLVTWTLSRKEQWKKDFVFFITTNGTVLNDEIKDWLVQNSEYVTVGLSLDGTPEAHNLNRSNSYDRIAPHLQFFRDTWPCQPVKMTISPQTVPMLFDGIMHVMSLGLPVTANVPMEDIWGTPGEKARRVEQFRVEIEKLVDFYNADPGVPLPSIIDLPISIAVSADRDRPWCGSGRSMAAIDLDGSVLPCHRYVAMSFDQSLRDKPLSPDTSRCRFCLFKAACQTCEANNWEVNGNPDARTTFHCEFTKWQVWGTAQVHSKRLAARFRELRDLPQPEQKEHADELAAIHQHLTAVAMVLEEFEKGTDLIEVGMLADWRERSAAPLSPVANPAAL